MLDYEITFDEARGIVVVRVNADITRDLVLAFGREASEEARRRGVEHVLVDVRDVCSRQPVFDQYGLAAELRSAGVDPRLRVASVVAPGDRSHDFIETVTRNRGFDVRLFEDIDLARAWLLEDTRP